ncbi:MAG: hypothetical protein ACYS76_13205 [Planctomycetota bacterium]
MDSANPGLAPRHHDVPPEFDGQIYFSKPMNVNEMRGFCINRHNQKVCSVFADRSGRTMELKELWELRWHRDWYSKTPDSEPDYTPPPEFSKPSHWMHLMTDYTSY